MTTGDRLKILRGEKTLEEVSKDTGITVRSLQAYETDYRTPSDERKVILSRYYGESIESIFFGKEFTKSEK